MLFVGLASCGGEHAPSAPPPSATGGEIVAEPVAADPSPPTPAAREERLARPTETRVAACRSLTLARLASGEVYAWGTFRYLDDAASGGPASMVPTRVRGLDDAVDLACDLDRVCVLWVDGAVACVPRASDRIALGSEVDLGPELAPLVLPAPARAIAMASLRICAVLDDGRVACDGAGDAGVLGAVTRPCEGGWAERCVDAPVVIEGLSDVRALSLSEPTSCALDGSGVVRCWGANRGGALGTGDVEESEVPRVVEGLPPSRALVVGGDFGCALDASDVVRCWGGRAEAEAPRMEVAALHGARSLVAFETAVCGVALERPVCVPRPVPPLPRSRRRRTIHMTGEVRIAGAATLAASELAEAPPTRALVAGTEHACIVATDDTVWCWGRNWDSAVGDAWAEARSRPGRVLGARGETSTEPLDAPPLGEIFGSEDSTYDFDDVSLAALDAGALAEHAHPRDLARLGLAHAAPALRACPGAAGLARVVVEVRLAPPDTREAAAVRVVEAADADAALGRCFVDVLAAARWPALLAPTTVRFPLVP